MDNQLLIQKHFKLNIQILVEVAMKIFRRLLCFSIVIFTTYIDIITACDGRSITYVATNSTSFPCPVDVVNCTSLTMNELITNGTKVTHNTCSNEFLFQQGSYDAKEIHLTFLTSEDLVIRGHDVTITCINHSIIILRASNIKIRGLNFQACTISLVELWTWPGLSITNELIEASNIKIRGLKFQACSISLAASSMVITNSIFNASNLTAHDILLATLQTIELIDASLKMEGGNQIRITGKGSSITHDVQQIQVLFLNLDQ